MAQVLGDRLEAIITPLGGGSPYGEDAKYDSQYLDLRAEIQKLTAMSSKETTIDWKSIKAWSIDILTTRSKDLTVAAYLTLALYVVDGYAGVRDGLQVLQALASEHWDGLFPPAKQVKARPLIFEWLVTRLSPLIADRAPAAADAEHLPVIAELVGQLQEVVSGHCAERTPSFADLVSAVAAHVAAAPPRQPEQPAAAEQPSAEPATTPAPQSTSQPAPQPVAEQPQAAPPAQTQAPPPAAAPAPPQPPAAAPPVPAVATAAPADAASATELRSQLLTFVAPLRQADPFSPLPYRLLRSLRWDSLQGPPVAEPGSGRTRIPPPRTQQRAVLDGHYRQQRWHELLHASEGAFQEPSGTFWLDLHYYSAMALERLDPAGTDGNAARVVRDEVSRLLERCGNIQGCTFADDSPMASELTRQWLAELAGSRGGSLLALAPAGDAGADAAVLEHAEMQEALQLFGKKRPSAAFSILQEAIERSANLRSRFRTCLAASRVCLEANQMQWAKTLLEDLNRQAEAFSFEVWQPGTAVELHQLLAVCYGRLAKDRKTQDRSAMQERFDQHIEKLFQLDMRAAAAVHEQL